ncbi:MAG: glycosyltransferase family 4 protein [Actinobacteria bacterium]|nr:glycosyltransferase family 4 protein [Actinomycetota bacterium]
MRVLVVVTVQHPLDARVVERQIGALLAAGHSVTLAAPFAQAGAAPPPGVRTIDVPRASGRRRVAAFTAARRVLRREAPRHDVVLLHEPELVAASIGIRHPVIVWDVHEDTAAAVSMKAWIPGPLRAPAAGAVRRLERFAERRMHLILAETAYADRFERPHPIIANTTIVPESVRPSERGRAIYVGTLTSQRGGDDLIEVGRRITPEITMEITGEAHGVFRQRLQDADARGDVVWHGYVANAQALRSIEGATVGLSLLHDEANYRHSMPTKLIEYLARGVPFVSTPLPLARELAEASGGGVIVPFGDPGAVADAVAMLNRDDEKRQAMADAGRQWVRDNADWRHDGEAFVAQLERWARAGPTGAALPARRP